MSAYVTDEPFEVSKAGKEYMLYSPRSVGIDFYGDNFFTTGRLLETRPAMVKKFRAASLRGWEYAMQHQEELVQLIYSRYNQRHSLEHLRFEASQMVPLLQVSTGGNRLHESRPLASHRRSVCRSRHDEKELQFQGIFVRSPAAAAGPAQIVFFLRFWRSSSIAVVSVLAAYIHRINRRLRQEASERKVAETQRGAALEALQTAFQENRNLLGELQHRVKNSFAMIAGMISLAINSSASPEVKSSLLGLDSRVRSISELYSLLYSTGSFTEVRLDQYCARIAASLVELMENIVLTTELENLTVPVKEAAPLGLILTNSLPDAGKICLPRRPARDHCRRAQENPRRRHP